MVDVRGGRVVSPAVVLVENGRIAAAGSAVAIPGDADVIDLGGATLLPGLIDAHDHLTSSPAMHGYNALKYSVPRRAAREVVVRVDPAGEQRGAAEIDHDRVPEWRRRNPRRRCVRSRRARHRAGLTTRPPGRPPCGPPSRRPRRGPPGSARGRPQPDRAHHDAGVRGLQLGIPRSTSRATPGIPTTAACGSSPAVPAMVAAGAVPIAHATDGGGSIRFPPGQASA